MAKKSKKGKKGKGKASGGKEHSGYLSPYGLYGSGHYSSARFYEKRALPDYGDEVRKYVESIIDWDVLKFCCTASIDQIMDWVESNGAVVEIAPTGLKYAYLDRGGDTLAVAHLDTVIDYVKGDFKFNKKDLSVDCHTLDDRLGLFVIVSLLTKVGVDNFDILLTEGEESGMSTAEYFVPDKQYNWGFEFDRRGTDVVLYRYGSKSFSDLVGEFFEVGRGSFSDISYLDLGAKCMNIGVGYHHEHTKQCYAYLQDTVVNVLRFKKFYDKHVDEFIEHDDKVANRVNNGRSYNYDYTLDTLDGYDYHNDLHGNDDEIEGEPVDGAEVGGDDALTYKFRSTNLYGGHCHFCKKDIIGAYYACGAQMLYKCCKSCFGENFKPSTNKGMYQALYKAVYCDFCGNWIPIKSMQNVIKMEDDDEWEGRVCKSCFVHW